MFQCINVGACRDDSPIVQTQTKCITGAMISFSQSCLRIVGHKIVGISNFLFHGSNDMYLCLSGYKMSVQRFYIWFLIGPCSLIMGASIKNARVIVTGGANGIGKQYAHYLLHHGAQVVAILDKDVENGTMTTDTLNNLFGENRVIFFPTDVGDHDQFEESFNMVMESFGGLDIMINNAGVMNDREWSMMLDTNVKGVIQGTLMAIDVMGKHKGGEGGTIINIASVLSLEGNKYVPIYSGSKSAVLGFSRSIALSYERTGVAIKIMCPDGTDTALMRSSEERYLDIFDQNEAIAVVHAVPLQKPEAVAKDVMKLIQHGPNGAIWVTSLNSPTLSINPPSYRQWGTPV